MQAKKGRRARGRRPARRQSSDDEVFKALANPDRREILDAIRDGPLTTKDICAVLPHLDRCTVMLHLKALERARLLVVRREGRVRWNALDVAPIQRIYSRWIQNFAAPAAGFLTQVRDELEADES